MVVRIPSILKGSKGVGGTESSTDLVGREELVLLRGNTKFWEEFVVDKYLYRLEVKMEI